MIMTNNNRDTLRRGDSVKIDFVKYNAVDYGKPGGTKLSNQFNNIRNKLLRLTGMDSRTRNPYSMKAADDLLSSNFPHS